jgi:hypothetical protein
MLYVSAAFSPCDLLRRRETVSRRSFTLQLQLQTTDLVSLMIFPVNFRCLDKLHNDGLRDLPLLTKYNLGGENT